MIEAGRSGPNLRPIAPHAMIFGDQMESSWKSRLADQAAEAFYHQGRAVRLIFPVSQFDDFNNVLAAVAKRKAK